MISWKPQLFKIEDDIPTAQLIKVGFGESVFIQLVVVVTIYQGCGTQNSISVFCHNGVQPWVDGWGGGMGASASVGLVSAGWFDCQFFGSVLGDFHEMFDNGGIEHT